MSTRRFCPRCKSSDIARSHRRIYERFVPNLAAYRCGDCKHRFLIFRGLQANFKHS